MVGIVVGRFSNRRGFLRMSTSTVPKATIKTKAMAENIKSAISELYWFSKEKLPRGFSYPLKRSSLDSALRANSVYDAVYSVRYLFAHHGAASVLDAQFVPFGRGVHPRVVGRSLITLQAVPSKDRLRVEEQILTTALPLLCDWLAQTQTKGNSWRGMPHVFAFQLAGEKCMLATNG
jgi:hypothetical protein